MNNKIIELIEAELRDFERKANRTIEEAEEMHGRIFRKLTQNIIIYLEDYRYKVDETFVENFTFEVFRPVIKKNTAHYTEELIYNHLQNLKNFVNDPLALEDPEQLESRMKESYDRKDELKEEKMDLSKGYEEIEYFINTSNQIKMQGTEAQRVYKDAVSKQLRQIDDIYYEVKKLVVKKAEMFLETIYFECKKSIIKADEFQEEKHQTPFL